MELKFNSRSVTILCVAFFILLSCNGQVIEENQGFDNSQVSGLKIDQFENKIVAIYQDNSRDIWFWGEEYIYQLNQSALLRHPKPEGLCSDRIIGIQQDSIGNVYFDTPDCIAKYDGNRISTLEIAENKSSEWKLNANDLWFRMGWDKGPFRYDGENLYALKFPKAPMEDEFASRYPNVSFNPYGIYSLYKDLQGNLWFGTSSLGFCRFDGSSFAWLYEELLTNVPNAGVFGFRSMIEEESGKYWLNNMRHYYEIEPRNKIGIDTIDYKRKSGLQLGLGLTDSDHPYFYAMLKDKKGNIWMNGLDAGIWRKSGNEFLQFNLKSENENVRISSLFIDDRDNVWIGSENDGVYLFNGTSFDKFKLNSYLH